MKLRTRITLIAVGLISAAIFVSDAVIWTVGRGALMSDTLQNAYHESKEIADEFGRFIESVGSDAQKAHVEYFFKGRMDDYTVCLASTKDGSKAEYFNHTVFSADELQSSDLKLYKGQSGYFEMEWNGRTLLCFHFYESESLELYHIVDASDAYRKLGLLTFGMAALLFFVTFASGVILSVLLGRSLRPLGELSRGAEAIAGGDYGRRIGSARSDELGALAGSFNKMAAAIEEHTRQLEESEMKKTLFMGNLTHELKTPLSAISGYAETMQRIKLTEEETAEALDYIRKECRRLELLSKKMLRLLELDHSVELAPEDFPVARLFEAAKRSCAALCAEKGVSIVIQETDEVLHADFDLMCDTVINLCDNAIRASGRGSEVRLYTEAAAGGGFDIVVEDFGCGIAPEECERILEPFYMVDKSRSRKSGGAGLGLSLASLILGHHGMGLAIESELGCGTRMRIYRLIKTR